MIFQVTYFIQLLQIYYYFKENHIIFIEDIRGLLNK